MPSSSESSPPLYDYYRSSTPTIQSRSLSCYIQKLISNISTHIITKTQTSPNPLRITKNQMFPDAETARCGECAYPTTVFIFGAVSVCILIFLLTFYRFLKNHCIRRDVNISQNNIARTETGGLASEIIISLPAVQFKNNEHRNSECSICLGVFEEGEWIRVLPNCAHVFHVSCVDIWLRSSSSCPLCRTDVLKDDGSSSSLRGSGTAIRAMEMLPREEPTQGTACSPRVVELWVVSYR